MHVLGLELTQEDYARMRQNKTYGRHTVKMKAALREFSKELSMRVKCEGRPEVRKIFETDKRFRLQNTTFTFFKYLLELPELSSAEDPLENVPVVLLSRDKKNNVFMMQNVEAADQETGSYMIMWELVAALIAGMTNIKGVFLGKSKEAKA